MKRIIVSLLLLGTTLSNANVLQGDKFFKEQKFDLAKSEYEASAQVGNAHAYYQLGSIYLKGLGSTKQDVSKALVYFNLAAESNFSDAKEIADTLASLMPVEHQAVHDDLVQGLKKHFGKQAISAKYFPQLIEGSLAKRVVLGNAQLNFNDSDLIDVYDVIDASIEDSFLQEPQGSRTISFVPQHYISPNDLMPSYAPGGVPVVKRFASQPVEGWVLGDQRNLIIDMDIGTDGSIREMNVFKNTIVPKRMIRQIAYHSLEAQPLFDNKKVPFVIRYRGYNSARTRNMMEYEAPEAFKFYRHVARRLKEKTDIENRYKYVMALTYHPWLNQEEGELEARLLELAELGHPQAQLELGMHLYREQKDIDKAIHWISQAASYGLTEAEYRLGRLFIESPWIIKDERKSLFWLTKASNKEHVVATQQIAKVKLTGSDNIFDVEGAKACLDKVSNERATHPEYHYLRALTFVKQEQRSMPQALASIRKAITLGDNLNWDVTEWQQLLDSWTTGDVNIQDM